MERPSKVAVPRPISSRMTRERGPAQFKIAAVSTISTMKVERPRARSSEAPTRENSRSTTPIRARSAGTYDPACASSTISAFWRKNVDLPAIFGPVTTAIRPPERSQSLGAKALPCACSDASTTGCRPPLISKSKDASTWGRVQSRRQASSASAATRSSRAKLWLNRWRSLVFAHIRARRASKSAFSRISAHSLAVSILASSSTSSRVEKRIASAIV